MAIQDSVVYQIWAMRVTLATTLIVVVLSWMNAVRISDIMIRGGVAFGVMYLLMAAILSLFEKTASQKPQNKQQSSPDAGRGGVIDFSVGDDELKPTNQPTIQTSNFPGQVDPSLSQGLPGSQQQADIVRRMGWDDENK